MKMLFILFYSLLTASCTKDTCERSQVISVSHCTYSHSGSDCELMMKNGKWTYGPEVEVGVSLCTKEMKGI